MQIQIFDGTKSTNELKGDYLVVPSSLKIKRDLTQSTTSEVQVVVNNKSVINKYDTFILNIQNHEYNKYITFMGRVLEITQDADNVATLKLLIGADANKNVIAISGNSQNVWNTSNDNQQNLITTFESTTSVICSDYALTFDTVIRQAMRQKTHAENYTVDNDKLNIIISQEADQQTYKLNLNDYDVSDKSIYIAPTSFNSITLIKVLEDGTSLYLNNFFNEDGDRVANPTQFPIIETFEKVEAENWNAEYATSIYKQQEYSNQIEFSFQLGKQTEALTFNSTFLGRKIMVYDERLSEPISTIISGYELNDKLKCSVTLGLSRTRLTDKLNKEVL